MCSSSVAGVIGLSIAYYCSRKGHRVTLIERGGPNRDGCSFVNAGMVVPSHIVPLASPGMVQLGLRWMWNPAEPVLRQAALEHRSPRLGLEVPSGVNPGSRRSRGASASRSSPCQPRLLQGMGCALEQRFQSDRARHADAVQHRAWSRGGGQGGRARTPARHCRRGADAGGDGRARAEPSHGHCRLGVLSRRTAIWRPGG